MNSYFSLGDWAIILIYLLGIILLGVWFGKDQRNTRDYFLGSKSVPWWGIGLSIVKEIVDFLHGSISAESQVGQGTRIRCLLPAI